MEYVPLVAAHPRASIRLVIVARRQLDSDAWAALVQAQADFCVLTATHDLKAAADVCRHRRPDAVLLDAGILGLEGGQNVSLLFDEIGTLPILLLDDDINDARLAAVLNFARIGYFTRSDSFEEVAIGFRRLLDGQRAYSSSVEERLIRTPTGLRLRRELPTSPFAKLTPRELEVLRLIAMGHTIKDCAVELRLSPSTVDNHKTRLMKKLGVHRSLDLTRLAVREGLIRL
jgi:two-component system, NarL family, response regulator NreC